MRREPIPPPAGWKMQVIEVVAGLFIATRLDYSTDYASLDVDVIVDLEDWEMAWCRPYLVADSFGRSSRPHPYGRRLGSEGPGPSAPQ
jgi:hypothetical protein